MSRKEKTKAMAAIKKIFKRMSRNFGETRKANSRGPKGSKEWFKVVRY